MSIDWSKYGVEKEEDKINYDKYHTITPVKPKKSTKSTSTGIEWSKYETKKPEVESLSDSYKKYKQETNSFGIPMLDPSKSIFMQQIEQYNADHPYGKQELQSPAHNNVPKSAAKVEPKKWNGILDNPIVNTAKSIDKNAHALVDGFGNAITFGLGNKLATLTGQQESVDNQHSAAGKVGEITGDLVGMGKAYKIASGLTKGLKAGKVLKTLATGFAAGTGYQTAKETVDMALPEQPTLTDLMNPNGMPQKETLAHRGLDIATTGAMFAGGDLALRYAGKGIKAISDKAGLTSKISKSFDSMFRRTKPSPTEPVQSGPILGLPEPKSAIMARELHNRSVLPANTDVIHGQGNIETLGLPQGQYTAPTRLKVSNPTETLDYVMTKIKPQVMEIIEAPARRDLLVQYIQKNTGYEIKDIINRPTKELQELGQVIQTDLHGKMQQIAFDVAKQNGHDLPALLEKQAPNLREQLAKDTQSQVYGVQPPKIGIQRPDFNVIHNADAAMPITKVGRATLREEVAAKVKPKVETVTPKTTVTPRVEVVGKAEPLKPKIEVKRTVTPSQRVSGIRANYQNQLKSSDEVKFAQTVRNSTNTADDLARSLKEQPITGSRTTDVLNRQEAAKMIEKHGMEGLHSKLITKTKQFSASETIAAQVLAKHYSSLGGKENLSKAIELISKTAKGGREMGQAIQALSQWNKLDAEGALLIGTRQLNKGERDLSQWKDLTPEQGAPITDATKRIGEAQATKDLADEVLDIVTKKSDGAALTEAEKATVKKFQEQVKLINEKGKGILSKPKANKADKTIKEVSQIEPKARTRDQVVSFLDAKAEKARQRIAASRNRLSSTPFDIYRDYAIIGASHIAKGVVKLSDFSEAMIRDFGDSVRPHINEVFNKATNIFRKENGLPTVEQLDKVVNDLVKGDVAAARKASNAVLESHAEQLGKNQGLTDYQIKVQMPKLIKQLDKSVHDLAEEAANSIQGRFTLEQAKQFKAWASEIGHYADKNLKIEATQDLQKALNDIGTSTLGEKIAATQTASQLLSVPTLLRNVVGNEAFNIVQKINKINAVPIDWAFSKFTGERTVVFSAKNQEKYWDNFIKGLKGGWKGVSPNGQFESYGIHPSAFKSNKNPLKYMQKALGAELQSFDHAAYMRAYGRTLGEYAQITGKKVEDLDQSIFDLADEAGRYATFQDDTVLSKLAVGTKKFLNMPTDKLASWAVSKGVLPEKLSWEGFGTGDLILKYAKTPANIVMRGIDFSPIGLLRGIGETLPLITGKTFNQRAATMALSRGITGTLGMTALGYALISAGVLTGKSSTDPDIRSLDQQTGKGEYKVNWSALSRYIKGGLDKKAAEWQKGDKITDWGWLQPMAISISMGVNAQQSVEKQKEQGTSSYVGVTKDALIGSLKTIMQQPLLSGVQNLTSGVTNVMRYGSWTGIANIFKGAPASIVPASLNQARNYSDNTTRLTYDPSVLKEALNMIINKVPGLDKKLPVAYDTLGGAREQIQDGRNKGIEQGLETFVSPVKMTKYTVSPEAKMVMDLINKTGNENIAPRTPNKYLMVNKRKVELTSKQYSEIQKLTGESTQKALSKISTYLSSDLYTDEQKAKKVIDTLNSVGDSVRTLLNKEYPELKPLSAYQLKHQAK